MSYEGYEQCICTNGHYHQHPADHLTFPLEVCSDCGFDHEDQTPHPCPECGAGEAWFNSVDTTNSESLGEIPLELLVSNFQLTAAIGGNCNMGHYHITSPAVFRIPTFKETQSLRHFRPDGMGPLILLSELDAAKMV